ncbi:hypothetical protein [Micropruina sonneratiae]|uniref:hypothetical protein n=1 Tax=Micropruina sonneratiae TaxID=2986940 RepID=UPI002225E5A2|nr:hypothetical protein [Micropruina sp. KQZ13P-5]MCW3159122.1 hypothetical protein [Micropruina sp. KQZ13P-5]
MRRVELGAVAALAAALLAGCVQPAEPTPSASPTPTYLCTPEAGGDEAPCSEADYQKMKEKDALYAEAEQVYRKYLAAYHAVAEKGGADKLPSSISTLIGDKQLASNIEQDLLDLKNSGLHVRGPGITVKSVERLPGKAMSGSDVTLRFCSDASANAVLKGSKKVNMGAISVDTVYLRSFDASVKIVAIQYKAGKCGG